MADPAANRLPAAVEIAGYAGVVPFILCLIGEVMLPGYEQRDLAQRIAVAYGAAVLTFAGAVHWGFALAGRLVWSPVRVIGAAVPAVVAAVAVVMGGQHGLALLVVGLGGLWLYEHHQLAEDLPAEYVSLRRNLSLAVCVLLALTLMLSDVAGLS
jgi:Protein of unknown function (DUF3429)